MNKQKKKAVIIGCGIAGPALALFLKRAGIESTIYESRDRDEGYSLSLSCNGVAILRMLELEESVFAEGSPVSQWSMWNGKGKYLGGGSFSANGIKSVFIKRVPLGAILSNEAERQGIPIQRGKKLKNIERTKTNGVIAIFEDGTTASGDFLVGCDGVHSKTRQFVDPEVRPVYSGLINSGGYSSGVSLPHTPETSHFIFGRRAFFGYHVSPSGYIYWFVNYPQAQEPARDSLREITHEEQKERLLALFREDQHFISEIIRSAETTFPDFPTYTLPVQPARWHKDSIVLVGDAVHAISPSSGQGASMALEDAAILAKCLRDIPHLELAFETYKSLRRERTAKMFDLGERSDSGKFIIDPFQQWFRDLTTPIFLKLFANPRASDWIYSYKVDWDVPVSAKESDK